MLALALVAGPVAVRAENAPVEVTQLRVERNEDGVLLSANMHFELPSAVEDALAKGIPMVFVADAVLSRERWYWTDKQISSSARHMRLSYQPLTRRWRLVMAVGPIGNAGLALGQSFDTREEAIAAVQRISRWKIAEAGEVETDGRYTVEFRFRLDMSQLPRPFQIGAVGQDEWKISATRTLRVTFDNPR